MPLKNLRGTVVAPDGADIYTTARLSPLPNGNGYLLDPGTVAGGSGSVSVHAATHHAGGIDELDLAQVGGLLDVATQTAGAYPLSSARTSGVLPVARGGTGLSTFPAGSLTYASSLDVLAALVIGGAGRVLRSTGTAPAWSSWTAPSTFPAGSIPYTSSLDTLAALAAPGATSVLTHSGSAPAWAAALAKAQLPTATAYLDGNATFDSGAGPQVSVLVTGTNPTLRLIASNGVVGGSSSSPNISFRDTPTNLIGTFDVLANLAAGLRYVRFAGQTDRDGNRVPVRLMTQNAAGTTLTGIEVSAGPDAGNVLVPNGKVGVGLTGVVQPSARLHVVETSAGAVVETLRIGNQAANVGTGSEIGFHAAASGAQKTASITAVATALSGATGALVLATQQASGAGPVEALRVDGAGVVRLGGAIATAAAAGEMVLGNAKALRSGNAAGTSTLALVWADASDVLRLLATRTTAATPGAFSPTHYIRVRDTSGAECYVPCMPAGW